MKMKGQARLQLGLALVVLAISAFLAFRVHAFFLFPKGVMVGFDERYLAPFGLRLLVHGSLPYVDAISHRGPLLYWMVELFQHIVGPFQWASLRWLALVFTWLTMGACFLVGLVARKPLAGAIASLFHGFVTTCALEVGAGIGVTGELVAAPFGLLSLASVIFAIERAKPQRRWIFLILGGIFASLAGLSKQTSLLCIVPLVVFVLLMRVETGQALSRRLAPLLFGWTWPFLATIALYVHEDALGSYGYWFSSYNAQIYMEPYAKGSALSALSKQLLSHPFLSLTLLLPLLAGLLLPLARARSFSSREMSIGFRRFGLEATVALQTALALFAALSPLRFWSHYFVLVVPSLGLLVGLGLERMLGSLTRPSLVARALLVLALLGGSFVANEARLLSLGEERSKGAYIDRRANAACHAVESHSRKSDSLFVWGFDGDFYIDCRRRPASRFVYTSFVAGVVPPFWHEPKASRVVPGARERLEADLRTSRPAVILDFYETFAISMRDIPQLGRLLEEDYCQLPDVLARGRRAGVWVRRGDEACGGR